MAVKKLRYLATALADSADVYHRHDAGCLCFQTYPQPHLPLHRLCLYLRQRCNHIDNKCLVLVEFNMDDFPLANTNAGVTALMSLVAIMTAEVLHGAVIGYCDFID